MSDASFDVDIDHVESILERYDTAGPRYTSYPTAPVWTEEYGIEAATGLFIGADGRIYITLDTETVIVATSDAGTHAGEIFDKQVSLGK